jgi:DNA-directed RNA polymerase subunit M/transcription elongation factor TFIIS
MIYAVERPEEFRENVCKKLKIMIYGDEETDETLSIDTTNGVKSTIIIIQNLEKGIYNYAIREATVRKIIKKWTSPPFIQLYMDKLRSIYFNLKQNVWLVDGIKSLTIHSQNVAFMTHQEFNPEYWKPLIEAKIKRDESKFEKKISASTDMFTCKKCKSKKCSYYEQQTRSCDEATTIFVQCLNCGKQWRC